MKYIHLLGRIVFIAVFFGLIGLSASFVSDRFTPLPVTAPSPKAYPVSTGTPPPQMSAKHVFVLDRGSGVVIYQQDADSLIYPASTTKMMTAIVAYRHFSLETPIVVGREYPEGVDIGLKPGESLTVSNLLYALLVQSANDAAEVLAENYPGGRDAFVAAMNSKAQELSLHHTRFLNPTGLDQDGHYSSAADLARIADHLLGFPYLARIVSTENAVISSPDHSSFRPLSNVNQLLGRITGVEGVKTGFTDLAGESVVTLVSRDGHEIIISLLGSTSRFADTENLINWVYGTFSWTAATQ